MAPNEGRIKSSDNLRARARQQSLVNTIINDNLAQDDLGQLPDNIKAGINREENHAQKRDTHTSDHTKLRHEK